MLKTMPVHFVKVTANPKLTERSRSTVGGYPILARDQEIPACGVCEKPMILFFQLDIREEFELPFKAGSHLAVFMCAEHNDASPADLKNKKWIKWPEKLPARFWKKQHHYRFVLNPPGVEEKVHPLESHLVPCTLGFSKRKEETEDWEGVEVGSQGFKVGGVPSWFQDPEPHRCACGARMEFVCQLPENFGFERMPAAPPQPHRFSDKQYGLFLGNPTYIFACGDQCDPRAVFATNQR
jgi:hypothetical protein